MRLITLLAFAGLFVTALSAGATTWLPNENVCGNMEAMGVLAPGPSSQRTAIEQTAANSGPGEAWQDGWANEEQITNNADTNFLYWGNGHKVVVASNGVRHLVWVTHNAKYVYALHYKRFYPSTGLWTADTVLSSLGSSSNTVIPRVSIALDANGTTIHVVWTINKHTTQCYYHVFYQKCVPGTSGNGGWVGTPTDLCTNHKIYAHCDPAVACVPGRVVVTWYEIDEHGYSIGFREFASNKWQNQVQLDGTSNYGRWLPSISATSNGDVFVACYGSQANEASRHVYVKCRLNNVWQSWEDATTGLPGVHFILPDIDVDPTTGYPHVVCHSYDTVTVRGYSQYHIYHTYRSASGWQPLEPISDDTNRVDCQPSMFFAGDGSAYVVWNDETGVDRGIMYRVLSPSGIWGEPDYITHYPGNPGYYDMCPNVTVSSTGDVYAVWMDGRNGPYQIWGGLCTPGSFGGPMGGSTVTPRGFSLDVSPGPASCEAVAPGQVEANPVGGGAEVDGWGSEVQITNNRLENVTYHNNGHKVVYGAGGIGHVVWYDNAGDAVYYKRYYPGSGWSKDLQLAKTAGTPDPDPAIALDSDGTTIHVVWRMWKHVGTTNFHIYYWKCRVTGPGTGGWVGNAMDLCENASGHDHVYPAVACGPNGQVVVTWMEAWGYPDMVRSYGFREYASGTWQPQTLIQDAIPSYRWNPSISADRSGNVFVAYYGSQSVENRDSFHVYVNSRIGTEWQEWENVTKSISYPDSFIVPDIDVNPMTGRPHIVCHSYSISVSGNDTTRYYHIYHSYRADNGWTVPVMISDPEARADCGPSMFFDANGKAHVVWYGYNASLNNYGVSYACCPSEGGEWTGPYWLSPNSANLRDFYPNITVAVGGALQLVWTRYDASSRYPYQIWGRTGTTSFGFDGPAAGLAVSSLEFALDVSPNPASRRMVVSYSLPAASNASLKLYDVRGALAKTVACGYVLAGSHTVSLSRQNLARGAYILKLESGASSFTRKLIIE